MGTTIRPQLSVRNQYWLDKHRYYELKHFCMQYPIWRRNYTTLAGVRGNHKAWNERISGSNVSDPTANNALERAYYSERMDMLVNAAEQTDSELASYILKGVTEALPYDHLKMILNIPCSRDSYYVRYRRFFWILDKIRK